MSILRIKQNLSFLIAGVILFGVVVNVYYELSNTTGAKEPQCQSTLIQ